MIIGQSRLYTVILCSALCFPHTAVGHPDTTYKQREDRSEGLEKPEISSYSIELVSALRTYPHKNLPIPELIRLRYFLSKPADVFVTVRELETRYRYRLDTVQKRAPEPGPSINSFFWPSEPVIKQTRQIAPPGLSDLADLGVVARLNSASPQDVEVVAPVVLYGGAPPEALTGYEFTFRLQQDADVVMRIGSDTTPAPYVTERRAVDALAPVGLKWDAARAPEGNYFVRVEGKFKASGQKITKLVHFYHRQ